MCSVFVLLCWFICVLLLSYFVLYKCVLSLSFTVGLYVCCYCLFCISVFCLCPSLLVYMCAVIVCFVYVCSVFVLHCWFICVLLLSHFVLYKCVLSLSFTVGLYVCCYCHTLFCISVFCLCPSLLVYMCAVIVCFV